MSITEIPGPEGKPSASSSKPDHDPIPFATRLEGDAVLTCSGELDPTTKPALRRALRRVVRLAPDRVVVDLSRVSFFDAGAIGEFVRARQNSRAAGGDLVVRAPTPFGRRVLSLVGLTNLIAPEPSRARVRGRVDRADDTPVASTPAQADPTVELAGRFRAGHRSRVVIDEAQGLIAEHFDIGITEASIMLQAFSTAQRQPLLAAAVALLDRSIDVARVAPHRPGRPDAPVGDPAPAAVACAPSAGS